MATSPSAVETKLDNVLNAWETNAADKSFGGMTLAQFKAAVKPSFDARSAIKQLESQLTVALDARDDADKVSAPLIQKVVNGVKGDPAFGEDSALYEAMGYIRKSERKSGKTNKPKTTPPPA
jgi:hypothetical protein